MHHCDQGNCGGTVLKWHVLDVNPEPWAIGDVGVSRHGGKLTPFVGRNNQLHTYKQAIADELGDQEWIEGDVTLRFLFWRNRIEYKTERQSISRAHDADATNLQKATEDALQGVLFKNDKSVKDIHSVLVAQGPEVKGKVVIGIERYLDEYPQLLQHLPDEVLTEINRLDKQTYVQTSLNLYDETPETLF